MVKFDSLSKFETFFVAMAQKTHFRRGMLTAILRTRAWQVVRAQLQRYPAVSRPIWNTYWRLFPREVRHLRDGTLHDRERAFREIFDNNEWVSEESKSGRGSALENTGVVRRRLPEVIKRYSVRTLLDAPCGDFNWMRLIDFPADMNYVGADIVPEMVDELSRRFGSDRRRFERIDIVRDPLPEADLWLCRHTFFHLPNQDVAEALRNFRRSRIRYLLTTNHNFCRRNVDINPGGFRYVNLRKPPFDLPKPLMQFDDYVILGPPNVLALWSREQIPDL